MLRSISFFSSYRKKQISKLSSFFFSLSLLSPLILGLQSCGRSPQKDLPVNLTSSLVSKSIIGKTDWVDLQSISQQPYAQVAKAVGLISIPTQQSRCTAFLISEDFIMTNWHCFPREGFQVGARFYPQFTRGIHSKSYLSTPSYLCSELMLSDEKRDVAILRCRNSPGKLLGSVSLLHIQEKDLISTDYPLMVIQQNCDYFTFPQCAPIKRLAMGKTTSLPHSLKNTIPLEKQSIDYYYNADTLGGSSGSPVFSLEHLAVMALHHQGLGQTPWSNGRGLVNSGVSMGVILDFLEDRHPEIYHQLSVIHL
jgi:hypothetical protein